MVWEFCWGIIDFPSERTQHCFMIYKVFLRGIIGNNTKPRSKKRFTNLLDPESMVSFLLNLGVEFPDPIFEFLFLCCTFAYLGSSTLVSVMLLSMVLVQPVASGAALSAAMTVCSDPATEELKLVLTVAAPVSGPGSGGDISRDPEPEPGGVRMSESGAGGWLRLPPGCEGEQTWNEDSLTGKLSQL